MSGSNKRQTSPYRAQIDKKIRLWNHRRIISFRRLRLWILHCLLDQRIDSSSFGPQRDKSKTRIIVLRTDGKLGDSITSTYLLQGLKGLYQNAHITVVSDPEFKPLFTGLIEDYIPFKLKFINAIKLLLRPQAQYDLLINTSHLLNPSSVLLSRFIRASRKMIFLNKEWKMFSDHIVFDANKDHVTARYDAVLNGLSSAQNRELSYVYKVMPSSREQVKKLLHQRLQQMVFEKLIVVNSFAGARLRNFNLETTKKLVADLHEKLPQALIVSMANPGDLRILSRWKSEIHCVQWIFFPIGSLDFNAALVEQADVVISPDTAIVHLSCALKKNLVAIYRQDMGEEKNQKIWGPIGKKATVIVAEKKNYSEADGDINTVDIPSIVSAVQKIMN